MIEPFFDPAQDSTGPKVYVGAHVPLKLYTLLVEEAERAMASRSDVLRWALAERYRSQDKGGRMQEAQGDERGE